MRCHRRTARQKKNAEGEHSKEEQENMRMDCCGVSIQSIYSILFYYYFVSFRLTTVVMITQILYKMVSKLFIRL